MRIETLEEGDRKTEKEHCNNHNCTSTLFTWFIWTLASLDMNTCLLGQRVHPYILGQIVSLHILSPLEHLNYLLIKGTYYIKFCDPYGQSCGSNSINRKSHVSKVWSNTKMRLKPNSLFQIVVFGKALNQKRKFNQIERSTKCQRFRLYIYIYI